MTTTPTKPPWYIPTPGKLIAGLLVIELCLFTADRLSLFGMERGSGWNVIWAVGIFLGVIFVGAVWFGVAVVLRSRFQFGILTLIGLMCCVAVVAGWFGWKWRMAQRQEAIVERIRELGGWAEYDYQPQWWAECDYRTQAYEVGVKAEEPPTWLRELVGESFFADVVFINSVGHTDSEMENLSSFRQLRALHLSWSSVTDAGMEHLKGFTNLQYLSLSNTRIGDAGLKHLKGLDLQDLDLGHTKITDAGLEHLASLTQLQRLTFINTQVGDAGMEHLKGLPRLEYLYLGQTHVGNVGLERLKQLPRLKQLYLASTQVDDAGLEHLKGLTQLECLDLNGTKVTDAGLEQLRGLRQLRELQLASTEVSNAGLEHIGRLTELRDLNLQGTQATDKGVMEQLKGLTKLEWLGVTHVTNEGVKELQQAWPNCKIIH